MRGRPRKPTARHKLEGTARADRMNAREPQYKIEALTKPPSIKNRPSASKEWDRICPIMLEQRTLSPAFRVAVEMYCLSYADVQDANRRWMRVRGVMEKAAWYRILRDAKKELRQWATECGLTQASAGKVSAGQPYEEESPLAKLQTQGQKLKAKGSQLRRVK